MGDNRTQADADADVVKLLINTKIAALEGTNKAKFNEKDVPVAKMVKNASKDLRKELDAIPPEKREEHLFNLLLEQKKMNFLEDAHVTFHENRCGSLEEEKRTLMGQLRKATDLTDKLDSLCRELQKRNKSLTEEIKQLNLAQKRHHEFFGEKFDAIQTQLVQQEDERKARAEENEQLQHKIGKLLQYDQAKEEQFAQQLKMKEIEASLIQAKLDQQTCIATVAQQALQQTKQEMMVMVQTEGLLRAQLEEYAKKFEGVQDTLGKSNELFITFKGEIESMSKQMRRQELANTELEKKNRECQASLVSMMERQTADKETIDKLTRQKEKLSSVCKVLETENKRLNLKTSNDPSPS